MKLSALVLPLLLGATLAASGAQPPLESRLSALAEKADGVVGVAVVDVASGRATASLDADEKVPMASTYKVPIALAVLHRADDGALLLSEKVEIESTDLVEGGMETLLKRWKPGLTVSVKELLDLMVVESDNVATDVLLRRLGGPPAVMARLEELGIAGIDVSRTEKESAADAYGVVLPKGGVTMKAFQKLRRSVPAAKREKAREAWEKDARDTATPNGMAHLLARLAKGELLKKETTELLLDAMRRCRTGAKRIRALLPKTATVYDKTGTAGRTTNDVGLVKLPDGRLLAIAVYVKSSDKPVEARERAIAEIARAAFDAFAAGPPAPVRAGASPRRTGS
jgi:beta-lactamase class A